MKGITLWFVFSRNTFNHANEKSMYCTNAYIQILHLTRIAVNCGRVVNLVLPHKIDNCDVNVLREQKADLVEWTLWGKTHLKTYFVHPTPKQKTLY